MALKETGYIRSGLTYAKGIGEPIYADEDYQSGAYIENGFPVKNDDAKPEHIVVHMGPQYTVINDDMDSRFRETERHVPKKVIRVGNSVRYVTEDEETEADRKERQADAVAAAVKSAILRGEIDASEFAIE